LVQVATQAPAEQTWSVEHATPAPQAQHPASEAVHDSTALPLHWVWPELHVSVQVAMQAPAEQTWLLGHGALTQSRQPFA
jgi:hypothetical protein